MGYSDHHLITSFDPSDAIPIAMLKSDAIPIAMLGE